MNRDEGFLQRRPPRGMPPMRKMPRPAARLLSLIWSLAAHAVGTGSARRANTFLSWEVSPLPSAVIVASVVSGPRRAPPVSASLSGAGGTRRWREVPSFPSQTQCCWQSSRRHGAAATVTVWRNPRPCPISQTVRFLGFVIVKRLHVSHRTFSITLC